MSLPEAVTGYLLAGGQSLRMGRDKAGVLVGGQTLLERGRGTLAAVCEEVVGVGPEREGSGLRWVADRRPGLGPLGGLEAALEDALARGKEWVLTVPVDVPLLPAGLLRALVKRWLRTAGCRVGFVEMEGQAQPAVALVQVGLLPAVRAALDVGQLRLRVVLEEGGAALGGLCRERLAPGEDGTVRVGESEALDWRPTAEEWARRASWFANVNSPEEVAAVEGVLQRTRGAAGASGI